MFSNQIQKSVTQELNTHSRRHPLQAGVSIDVDVNNPLYQLGRLGTTPKNSKKKNALDSLSEEISLDVDENEANEESAIHGGKEKKKAEDKKGKGKTPFKSVKKGKLFQSRQKANLGEPPQPPSSTQGNDDAEKPGDAANIPDVDAQKTSFEPIKTIADAKKSDDINKPFVKKNIERKLYIGDEKKTKKSNKEKLKEKFGMTNKKEKKKVTMEYKYVDMLAQGEESRDQNKEDTIERKRSVTKTTDIQTSPRGSITSITQDLACDGMTLMDVQERHVVASSEEEERNIVIESVTSETMISLECEDVDKYKGLFTRDKKMSSEKEKAVDTDSNEKEKAVDTVSSKKEEAVDDVFLEDESTKTRKRKDESNIGNTLAKKSAIENGDEMGKQNMMKIDIALNQKEESRKRRDDHLEDINKTAKKAKPRDNNVGTGQSGVSVVKMDLRKKEGVQINIPPTRKENEMVKSAKKAQDNIPVSPEKTKEDSTKAPEDDVKKTDKDANKPGKDASKPVKDANKTDKDANKPGKDFDKPGRDANKPDKDSSKPVKGVNKPGKDAKIPDVNKTDKIRPPSTIVDETIVLPTNVAMVEVERGTTLPDQVDITYKHLQSKPFVWKTKTIREIEADKVLSFDKEEENVDKDVPKIAEENKKNTEGKPKLMRDTTITVDDVIIIPTSVVDKTPTQLQSKPFSFPLLDKVEDDVIEPTSVVNKTPEELDKSIKNFPLSPKKTKDESSKTPGEDGKKPSKDATKSRDSSKKPGKDVEKPGFDAKNTGFGPIKTIADANKSSDDAKKTQEVAKKLGDADKKPNVVATKPIDAAKIPGDNSKKTCDKAKNPGDEAKRTGGDPKNPGDDANKQSDKPTVSKIVTSISIQPQRRGGDSEGEEGGSPTSTGSSPTSTSPTKGMWKSFKRPERIKKEDDDENKETSEDVKKKFRESRRLSLNLEGMSTKTIDPEGPDKTPPGNLTIRSKLARSLTEVGKSNSMEEKKIDINDLIEQRTWKNETDRRSKGKLSKQLVKTKAAWKSYEYDPSQLDYDKYFKMKERHKELKREKKRLSQSSFDTGSLDMEKFNGIEKTDESKENMDAIIRERDARAEAAKEETLKQKMMRAEEQAKQIEEPKIEESPIKVVSESGPPVQFDRQTSKDYTLTRDHITPISSIESVDVVDWYDPDMNKTKDATPQLPQPQLPPPPPPQPITTEEPIDIKKSEDVGEILAKPKALPKEKKELIAPKVETEKVDVIPIDIKKSEDVGEISDKPKASPKEKKELIAPKVETEKVDVIPEKPVLMDVPKDVVVPETVQPAPIKEESVQKKAEDKKPEDIVPESAKPAEKVTKNEKLPDTPKPVERPIKKPIVPESLKTVKKPTKKNNVSEPSKPVEKPQKKEIVPESPKPDQEPTKSLDKVAKKDETVLKKEETKTKKIETKDNKSTPQPAKKEETKPPVEEAKEEKLIKKPKEKKLQRQLSNVIGTEQTTVLETNKKVVKKVDVPKKKESITPNTNEKKEKPELKVKLKNEPIKSPVANKKSKESLVRATISAEQPKKNISPKPIEVKETKKNIESKPVSDLPKKTITAISPTATMEHIEYVNGDLLLASVEYVTGSEMRKKFFKKQRIPSHEPKKMKREDSMEEKLSEKDWMEYVVGRIYEKIGDSSPEYLNNTRKETWKLLAAGEEMVRSENATRNDIAVVAKEVYERTKDGEAWVLVARGIPRKLTKNENKEENIENVNNSDEKWFSKAQGSELYNTRNRNIKKLSWWSDVRRDAKEDESLVQPSEMTSQGETRDEWDKDNMPIQTGEFIHFDKTTREEKTR